jgi:hypothetical protein
MKRLLAIALLLVGCGGVGSTPAISPSPAPTIAPTAAVPSAAARAAGLQLVRCKVNLTTDPNCRQDGYRITSPIKMGKVVTLTFTVRNVGKRVSGPVTGVILGCSQLAACKYGEYLLPDRFTFVGCTPGCRGRLAVDRASWHLQWAGKIKPGKAMNLTVTFKAKFVAYNYVVAGVYAAPLAVLDANLGHWDEWRIAEWTDIQVVVLPR